jgi:hypothetical protein
VEVRNFDPKKPRPEITGRGFLFLDQPAKWHSTSPSSRLVMRGVVAAQGAKQAGQRG